jgi:hypothetical protein
MELIRASPTKKVFDEPLRWSVKSRTDTHNAYAMDSYRRTPKPRVFNHNLM